MSAAIERRRSRRTGLGLLAVAATLLAINGIWIARHLDALRPIAPGDVAPAFALPAIDDDGRLGQPIALESLRGKVVLIDFWASWCRPCLDAMPAIERVYRKLRRRGFVVLSVNTEGPGARERARIAAAGTSFLLLSDDGHAKHLYKVRAIPHMVLVDHLGVIRRVHRGASSGLERQLERQVLELLGRIP